MTLNLTRRGLAVGAVAAALPLLSGCATFSPATTLVPYNASDGMGLQLGQLEAHNLLVVGAAKGAEGVLSGALVNTGNDPLTVAVSTQGAPTPVTIQVAAHTMVRLTADSSTPTSGATAGSVDTTATVLVPSLAQPPGSVVTVQIATQAGGQKQIKVPVIPPQNEYASITAPPTTPSATQSPSGQPVSGGDESAQPTTSPS
jgi:hypothetical protein